MGSGVIDFVLEFYNLFLYCGIGTLFMQWMNQFCSDFHCSIACSILIEGRVLVLSALNLCRSDSLILSWLYDDFPNYLKNIEWSIIVQALHNGVIGHKIAVCNYIFFCLRKELDKMKEPPHHIFCKFKVILSNLVRLCLII